MKNKTCKFDRASLRTKLINLATCTLIFAECYVLTRGEIWFVTKIYLPIIQKQEHNEIKNHLAVLFVRVSLSIHYCCLHAKLLILFTKSCIPSILIDPERMGFSTNERYQKPVAFGSINLYNNTEIHPRFLCY